MIIVINDQGGSTTTDTGSATVADAPLTAGTVSAGGGVEYTTPANLSATFTDANLVLSTSDFSGTINWGDGHTTPFTSMRGYRQRRELYGKWLSPVRGR